MRASTAAAVLAFCASKAFAAPSPIIDLGVNLRCKGLPDSLCPPPGEDRFGQPQIIDKREAEPAEDALDPSFSLRCLDSPDLTCPPPANWEKWLNTRDVAEPLEKRQGFLVGIRVGAAIAKAWKIISDKRDLAAVETLEKRQWEDIPLDLRIGVRVAGYIGHIHDWLVNHNSKRDIVARQWEDLGLDAAIGIRVAGYIGHIHDWLVDHSSKKVKRDTTDAQEVAVNITSLLTIFDNGLATVSALVDKLKSDEASFSQDAIANITVDIKDILNLVDTSLATASKVVDTLQGDSSSAVEKRQWELAALDTAAIGIRFAGIISHINGFLNDNNKLKRDLGEVAEPLEKRQGFLIGLRVGAAIAKAWRIIDDKKVKRDALLNLDVDLPIVGDLKDLPIVGDLPVVGDVLDKRGIKDALLWWANEVLDDDPMNPFDDPGLPGKREAKAFTA